MHVLLIEDDDGLGRALVDILSANDYQPTWCRRSAVPLIARLSADVVLFDLGVPSQDGFEALQRLRRLGTPPILALSTRHDGIWATRARRAGADEYLIKPIKPRELLAKVNSMVRRNEPRAERVVEVMDVSVNLDARTVFVSGEPVALTIKEFDVLAVLARHAGRAVSRRQIMDEVWGQTYPAVSRSLDVHMTALRAKLNRPRLLHTIRGFGYRFDRPNAAPKAPTELKRPAKPAPALHRSAS